MQRRLLTILAIIIIIAVVYLPANASISQTDASLQHAEHMLQKVSYPGLSNPYDICGTRSSLLEIEDILDRIVDRYGPNGKAYSILGKVRMRLGKYPQALESFSLSVPTYPDDSTIASEIKKAQLLAQIVEKASNELPLGQQILQIEEYPIGKSDRWLVLTASGTTDANYTTHFTEGRLTRFESTSGKIRKIWQSDRLIFADDNDMETLNEMVLFIKDITGDGVPEAVVHEIVQGAWWSPSHMDVFGTRNGQMTKLLGVRSEFPLEVIDIDNDSRYEIISKKGIGTQMSRSEQPFWTDIYAYRNGVYQLSNGDYPEKFRSLNTDIRIRLQKYPNDTELKKYKTIINNILLNPSMVRGN